MTMNKQKKCYKNKAMLYKRFTSIIYSDEGVLLNALIRWIKSVIRVSIILILVSTASSLTFKLSFSYSKRISFCENSEFFTCAHVSVKLLSSSVIRVCSSEITLTDCPNVAASACKVCNALRRVNKAGVRFKSGSTFSSVANNWLIYN